jgi:hypothetical protein
VKEIIIGTSLSGKTTLIRYLRANSELPILEIDEELTRLNNGEYPTDDKYKHMVLAPKVVQDILSREYIVFFTNTDYFTPEDLRTARSRGFKVLQLIIDLEELKRRNELRIKNDGYSDLSEWLSGMLQYQTKIMELGLVDRVLNGDLPTEKIARQLLEEGIS